MPAIALVDDNSNMRDTVAKNLRLFIPDQWEVVAEPPLERPSEYPPWLIRHDIAVLLIDWRLNDSRSETRRAVDYEGDAIVDVIRQTRPNFPIFVITAYPKNENLILRLKDLEYQMKRDELSENPEVYVERMIRAGMRYWKDHQADLALMSDLAGKVACSTASANEIEELKALQTGLGLSFRAEESVDQAELLAEADAFRQKVDGLRRQIKDFLKNEDSQ